MDCHRLIFLCKRHGVTPLSLLGGETKAETKDVSKRRCRGPDFLREVSRRRNSPENASSFRREVKSITDTRRTENRNRIAKAITQQSLLPLLQNCQSAKLSNYKTVLIKLKSEQANQQCDVSDNVTRDSLQQTLRTTNSASHPTLSFYRYFC